MLVQIVKRADGAGVLRCLRADGTVTWQKQNRQAAFFALHDLTHFAVESVLGYQRGFFGLVAEGWDIEDTTGKGKRGPLPDQAVEVEYIVGSFPEEGIVADDFNRMAAIFAEAAGRPGPRPLTEDDLNRLRKRRQELFSAWNEVVPGATLELRFDTSEKSRR
jgi:hypothetical protein